MQILFVSDVSINNIIGGAERVLFEQSTRLARAGHNVTILTRRNSAHQAPFETINNVQEYRYAITDSHPIAFLDSTIRNGQRIYREISSKKRFDVINFHQPFSALAVNLLRETAGIKKVYTCHSLSFEEYASRHPKTKSFLQMMARKTMEQFSLERSSKIVVLSEFTKQKLAKTYGILPDKMVTIPGGADTDYFRPAHDREALKKNLNLPQKAWILFTVRNLVPRMGLENLIKAMALIKNRNQKIILYIGGQGELKETLLSLIKELGLETSVQLLGFLSKEQLLDYYQTADFFILPTAELEGFGLVTVESMACGTPVLGTPVGGTLEILNTFDSSFLFQGVSAEQIADGILQKHSQFSVRNETYNLLRQRVRSFASDHYSWERNIAKLSQLL
ncbi:MAG: glycosyltransferase family 4 protein [Candidatus Omnitrophica bacterium]|nr:glycosyltransferase family 4 protein [Candidatus Omnitrophota bacterium]